MLIHAIVDFPLNQPVAALLFWLGIGTVAAVSHPLLIWPMPWASWRPAWRWLLSGAIGLCLLLVLGIGAFQAVRPVMASAYQRDSWRLMVEQRWPEAIPMIEQGLAWDPHQAELTLYLGVSHYQLGNLARSRAAYERYQSLYSDYQTLYNLGLIAVRERQLGKAEDYFRLALRYKPTLAEAAAALAIVAEQKRGG